MKVDRVRFVYERDGEVLAGYEMACDRTMSDAMKLYAVDGVLEDVALKFRAKLARLWHLNDPPPEFGLKRPCPYCGKLP